MYKNSLDKLLDGSYNLKSILLYGESDFYIDYYCKKIVSLISSEDKMTLYFDEYNYNTAYNYLAQSSLFGDKNLLIVKSDAKIHKKELDKLIELTNKNDNSYFIYMYTGSDFKSLLKAFDTKVSDQVRFFHPNINEALIILQENAQKFDIDIDTQLLKYLYDSQDMNLAYAINELKKLSILNEEISINTIDKMSYNLNSNDMNSVIFDILSKKDFKVDLFKLFEEGEDEIKFISTITSLLVTLVEFSVHARLFGQVDSKEILGYKLPKFIEQKYISYSTKISITSFSIMISFLQERELYLKQNIKIDKSAFLYTILSKLQTYF
jgi:DNA polymerase-3 subunit delta